MVRAGKRGQSLVVPFPAGDPRRRGLASDSLAGGRTTSRDPAASSSRCAARAASARPDGPRCGERAAGTIAGAPPADRAEVAVLQIVDLLRNAYGAPRKSAALGRRRGRGIVPIEDAALRRSRGWCHRSVSAQCARLAAVPRRLLAEALLWVCVGARWSSDDDCYEDRTMSTVGHPGDLCSWVLTWPSAFATRACTP